MRTLSEEGAELALSGATSLEEVLRVTRNEGDFVDEEPTPTPPDTPVDDADTGREAA